MKYPIPLILVILCLCCETPKTKNDLQDREIDQIIEIKDQSMDLFPNPSTDQSTDQSIDQSTEQIIKSGIDGLFEVQVLLDGVAVENAMVSQGGTSLIYNTDRNGRLTLYLDLQVAGQLIITATHPLSRTVAQEVESNRQEPLIIELSSYQASQDGNYKIADPGEPSHRNSTAQCGHCHLSNNDAWFNSPHRSSAKNEVVYDLLMGRGHGWQTQEECQKAGGKWQRYASPGQDEPKDQCFFEISAFKAYNENCQSNPCEQPSRFGGCADCHAPAINNRGHQNLLDARGIAYEYGVSCDICHRVDQVLLDQDAGVAGRLILSKPLERASVTLGAGGVLPLTFGPNADVPNPRMGISPRDHYQNGLICGGCHLHTHNSTESRFKADINRWPDQKIPNQSTYQEWKESIYGDQIPCNECHMPAVADMANGGNLEKFPTADIGVQAGWPRGIGESRQHAWWGPRQKEGKMLELSSTLKINLIEQNQQEIILGLEVSNIGAGHALPTGEPMRHLIALIELRCNGEKLALSSGDLVHQIGGYAQIKSRSEGFDRWELAEVGDEIRVISLENEFYDYDGVNDFAKLGRFQPEQKGLQKERFIGDFQVTQVDENHRVTLNQEISSGDIAYLIKNQAQYPQYAGLPGFSFARVMTSEEYQPHKQLVPHFIATDIQRDNRLKPMQKWESQHHFMLTNQCMTGAIQAKASLIYRPYPLWLAQERGWYLGDQLVKEVYRDIQINP